MRDRADRVLVDADVDERVDDGVVGRRLETRAILAEVVGVRPRDHLRVGAANDRVVQVRLAVEAAVHGVADVVRVTEFAGVDDLHPPPLLKRVVMDPVRGFRWHRRRDGVEDLGVSR